MTEDNERRFAGRRNILATMNVLPMGRPTQEGRGQTAYLSRARLCMQIPVIHRRGGGGEQERGEEEGEEEEEREEEEEEEDEEKQAE